MIIIKQNEIEKAAIEQAEYVVQEHTHTEWNHQELKSLLKANFKGSIKWAESKFEEIAIEFGRFAYEHYEDSYLSFEDLFQLFLKKRNEEKT